MAHNARSHGLCFSFTIPHLFPFELLQQDIHQHLLSDFIGKESLKPSFTDHILTKPQGTKCPSGKTKMVQHYLPTKSSTPIILQCWFICILRDKHTHMHLPPGRSWLRSVCSNIAMGIPTFLERPATNTFFPTVSIPAKTHFQNIGEYFP